MIVAWPYFSAQTVTVVHGSSSVESLGSCPLLSIVLQAPTESVTLQTLFNKLLSLLKLVYTTFWNLKTLTKIVVNCGL